MKTFRILATCLALITIPVLIESCCLGPGSCGCGGGYEGPTRFDIKSMVVSIVNAKGIGAPSQFDPPSPGPLSNHAFYVLMDAEYRRALLESPPATMAAYACSPPEPIGDQKITSITITSNNDLTTSAGVYNAGLDISHLFNLLRYGTPEVIATIYGEDLVTTAFYLVSNEVVNVTQKHKFTITVTLDDGRSFELKTEEAELTPS